MICLWRRLEAIRTLEVGRWLGQPSANLVGQRSLFAYHAVARYGGQNRTLTFSCDACGGQRDSTSAALPNLAPRRANVVYLAYVQATRYSL